MKASLIQLVRKKNGFKVFNENSNEEFVEIFTMNGVESITVKLKRWINSKLPVEKFITAFKKIIDSQDHQYDEAISRTVDVSFSLSFKHIEVGREWFQWNLIKCKKHRKVVVERNVLAEDYATESIQASESVQVDLINDIKDLSCNKLPFCIPEEVIN